MYAKVFNKIMDSSIAADWYLRHVFMDLLVLSDRDGVVDMTIDAIRRRTNAPDEMALRLAIRTLEQPDINSRSDTDDGRRLERIDEHRDWGWRIINYPKYRKLRTSQEIREQTAERVRKHRALKRDVTQPVTQAYAYADINTPLPTLPGPEAGGSPPTGATALKRMPRVQKTPAEIEERKRFLKEQAASMEKTEP